MRNIIDNCIASIDAVIQKTASQIPEGIAAETAESIFAGLRQMKTEK